MARRLRIPVKQLAEDFARYLFLPRLRNGKVLVEAVQDGVAPFSWRRDSFAYADAYDEVASHYRGLRSGQHITVSEDGPTGLLRKPGTAQKQFQAEQAATATAIGGLQVATPSGVQLINTGEAEPTGTGARPAKAQPKRFYGSVELNP